jgi:hypothetical protein
MDPPIDLRAAVPWAKQHHARVERLGQLDRRIATAPNAVEPRLERAALLVDLGLRMEAIGAYLDVLAREPYHYDAMLQLGTLFGELGDLDAARGMYAEAAARHPGQAAPLAALGGILSQLHDEPGARAAYEAALAADPACGPAHRGLAPIYHRAGETEAATHAWRAAFPAGAWATSRYRGIGEPVRVLVLTSALGGNIPLQHVLDDRLFQWSELFVEAHSAAAPLPPHAVVFNAVGDADRCAGALELAEGIIARSPAPIINPPARVAATGRAANAQRLGSLPDVIAPRIVALSRTALAADGAAALAAHGFTWPLLVRSPGYQTGEHFALVRDPAELADAVAALPGDELLAISWLDTRSADGAFRKYRVMTIDGRLYPLHLAIAQQWKVHYFSAAMTDEPGFRAEERAFLDDMPGVLGARAIAALQSIATALDLPFAGIDFALGRDGRVVAFEANATMVILPPGSDERFTYRRPAFEAAQRAARNLIARYANPAGPGYR